jgi:hypothetical protein
MSVAAGVKIFDTSIENIASCLLARLADLRCKVPKSRRKDAVSTPKTVSQKVAPDETFPQVLRLYL